MIDHRSKNNKSATLAMRVWLGKKFPQQDSKLESKQDDGLSMLLDAIVAGGDLDLIELFGSNEAEYDALLKLDNERGRLFKEICQAYETNQFNSQKNYIATIQRIKAEDQQYRDRARTQSQPSASNDLPRDSKRSPRQSSSLFANDSKSSPATPVVVMQAKKSFTIERINFLMPRTLSAIQADLTKRQTIIAANAVELEKGKLTEIKYDHLALDLIMDKANLIQASADKKSDPQSDGSPNTQGLLTSVTKSIDDLVQQSQTAVKIAQTIKSTQQPAQDEQGAAQVNSNNEQPKKSGGMTLFSKYVPELLAYSSKSAELANETDYDKYARILQNLELVAYQEEQQQIKTDWEFASKLR